MELIFNPCGEFWWSPEGPVSQIHSLHLLVGATGIFSDLLRSVKILKREWGAESNGKLPHLFIPSKTATLVPEFAVEDLPLGIITALVHEFVVKDLPFSRTKLWKFVLHSESLGLKNEWEREVCFWVGIRVSSDSMVERRCVRLEIWGSNPSLDTNFSLNIYIYVGQWIVIYVNFSLNDI